MNNSPRYKPGLCLDCDGVITNFSSWALQKINKRFKTKFKEADWKEWELASNFGKEASDYIYELMADPAYLVELEAYPNAITLVKRLQTKYDILVLTSIPVKQISVRRDWIKRVGLTSLPVIHCDGNRKPEQALSMRAPLVEDKPTTILAASWRGVDTYAVSRPYTDSMKMPPEVFLGTLEQITGELLK